MKLTTGRFDGFLRRPDPGVFALLLYGPDQGLVTERGEAAVRAIVDQPDDPFGVASFSAESLRADPGRLADDARSLSLLGGRRSIRVRQAGDALAPACELLLGLAQAEAFVIVEAGDLPARSSLRKLFEASPKGAACACYREEGDALAGTLMRMLAERHLKPDDDALAFLAGHLGADRGVTKQEVDKLALFVGAPDSGPAVPLRLEDAVAAVGDGAALGLNDLCAAATLGERHRVERIVERLLAEAVAPVAIVRTLQNHVARLGRLAAAADPKSVVGTLRPPVPYRARDGLFRAARLWRRERLDAALVRLLDAEIACKTTHLPAATLARRAALQLAEDARSQVGGAR